MTDWPLQPGRPPAPEEAPLGRVLRGTLAHSLRWLVVAVVAGLFMGPVIGLFEEVLSWCTVHLWSAWLWGLPIAGGLAVGCLLLREMQVGGTGTQTYIQTFEENRRLPGLLALEKLFASLLTLGSGGSGGKAGPAILVGGSAGSALSRGLRVDRGPGPDLGALIGAGAALGALFGAPLAGGLMAAEILYAEGIHYRGLFAAIIASCVGAASRQLVGIPHVRVAVDAYSALESAGEPVWWLELAEWLGAALVAAGVSLGFILLYAWTERKFREWIGRDILRPAVGAGVCLAVGLVCLLLLPGTVTATRGVFGTGEDLLRLATEGRGPVVVIALLLIGKAVATAATVSSGGSGGLVFPALILGALSGALVAGVAAALGLPVGAELPVVGMAAALAAVVNVPVAAAILLLELFGLGVTVPVVVGAGAGFVLGRPWVIYRYSRPPEPN